MSAPGAALSPPPGALRAFLRRPGTIAVGVALWIVAWGTWTAAYTWQAKQRGAPGGEALRVGLAVGTVDAVSWLAAGAAAFVLAWTVPLPRRRPWPGIALTVLGVLAIVVVRLVLIRAWHVGQGGTVAPFFADLPRWLASHFSSVAVFVGAGHGIRSTVADRERRLALARLGAEVAEARLRALQARLRPRFLFDSLGAAADLAGRDPAAAERLLAQLGEMLRQSFRGADAEWVPLQRELSSAMLFLEIERTRGAAPVHFRSTADRAAREAPVPRLGLFPLVEGAVLCGEGTGGPGRVEVVARRGADALEVEVRDDLPLPLAAREAHPGWEGVRLLRARLEALPAGDCRLRFDDLPGGGVRASLSVAAREGAA